MRAEPPGVVLGGGSPPGPLRGRPPTVRHARVTERCAVGSGRRGDAPASQTARQALPGRVAHAIATTATCTGSRVATTVSCRPGQASRTRQGSPLCSSAGNADALEVGLNRNRERSSSPPLVVPATGSVDTSTRTMVRDSRPRRLTTAWAQDKAGAAIPARGECAAAVDTPTATKPKHGPVPCRDRGIVPWPKRYTRLSMGWGVAQHRGGTARGVSLGATCVAPGGWRWECRDATQGPAAPCASIVSASAERVNCPNGLSCDIT